jgi:hypothetical protein
MFRFGSITLKNTPDLEIIWFPFVIGGSGIKTPPGTYGVTIVRLIVALLSHVS